MRRPLLLRCWAAFDIALCIPLGTGSAATSELQRILDAHAEHVHAWQTAADGRRLPAGRLALLVALGVAQDARLALRLMPELGGETPRAQRVAEPSMVFLPAAGLPPCHRRRALGAWGAAPAATPFAGLCSVLYRRVHAVARHRPPSERSADRDAVWTVPNAITFCRMLALGFFPVVLAHVPPFAVRAVAYAGLAAGVLLSFWALALYVSDASRATHTAARVPST